MTTPVSHWSRLTDRGFEIPVAIFDLDGVLSDAGHRQHFLRADPPDWDGFGSLAHLDQPLEAGQAELEVWRAEHLISVVTARPVEMRDLTVEWFGRHELHVDLVVFRPSRDRRPSQELKQDELDRIRSLWGDVRVAFDDDHQNVEMYEAAGVRAVYVHSGYYEQGKAQP